MTSAWRERRTNRSNQAYEGQDRRWFGDGAISPAERFSRNEEEIRLIKASMDRVESKLDRLAGAIALMLVVMPIVLFVLNRLFM